MDFAGASSSSNPSSRPDSRTATPRPRDHVVLSHHRLSQKEVPPDCPPMSVRWFYAVDVPKRKPFPKESDKNKKPPAPNKFVPFSSHDSKAIEVAFQKLVELEDEIHARRELEEGDLGSKLDAEDPFGRGDADSGAVKVLVNEDYLFEVDVRARELAPVYWMGNTYDVRRGTWFMQEGSTLKPCDENLATQIEEGYLRLKPFRRAAPTTGDITDTTNKPDLAKPQQTWRLFGAHMNDFVVYVDSQTAWLLSDNFYGKISSTVTQRITFGSHMGGWKLVRGYSEGTQKATEDKAQTSPKQGETKRDAVTRPVTPIPKDSSESTSSKSSSDAKKRRSLPPPKTPGFEPDSPVMSPTAGPEGRIDRSRLALERKMSSFEITDDDDGRLNETDMKEDYSHDAGDDQGRDIDHLILVTHGIGQRLGMRVESVNFVHDVNVMRKTIKSVYNNSSTLQALNNDLNVPKKNPRIQVLPVCWRHLLDLPDASNSEPIHGYTPATLQEITPTTVPAVRNLMSDLALDVLLYHAPSHQARIEKVVAAECNRIISKFRSRQSKNWKGKIHLAGHSLGSAIFWDLLHPAPGKPRLLDFDVASFFTLGSPLPMFLLLRPPPAVPTTPPKHQLFNIFHPCDPLAYRFEPLISRGAAAVKPQDIPYTKASIFSDRGWGGGVQRGVVGWWRGVVSGVLQRGLGFEDGPAPSPTGPTESTEKAKKADQATLAGTSGNPDGTSSPNEAGTSSTANGPPLPREVTQDLLKWNRTGRVDFAIQEGAFDISLIASIASHLGYWGDEDVAHFIAGQVLAGSEVEGGKVERDLGEGLGRD